MDVVVAGIFGVILSVRQNVLILVMIGLCLSRGRKLRMILRMNVFLNGDKPVAVVIIASIFAATCGLLLRVWLLLIVVHL